MFCGLMILNVYVQILSIFSKVGRDAFLVLAGLSITNKGKKIPQVFEQKNRTSVVDYLRSGIGILAFFCAIGALWSCIFVNADLYCCLYCESVFGAQMV